MTNTDKERIRALAKKQLALAHSGRNQTLFAEWRAHGELKKDTRPMLRVELWTFEEDILPPLLECEDADARKLEAMLLRNTINFELFRDDTLVPDHISYRTPMWFTPFGLPVMREETGSLGHRFTPYLSDLEEDFHKLNPSAYGFDAEAGERERARLHDLIGDILPIRQDGISLYAVPTQDIVHIMSMEDMFTAMYDAPEKFHEMMDLLTRDYEAYFRMLEREGLLTSAANGEHLSQGSYCFTHELPGSVSPAHLSDLWLYMDSQETSGISPAMYREFIFPYYARLMSLFGLVSYGCCEAVHGIWESCLSKVPNIRKVSISPWCDEAFMGEALRTRCAVYLRKPSPNFLGVGESLDESAVYAHFRKTAQSARGCKLELAQRDVYRVGSWQKVRRYVEIAREAMGEYQP